MPLTNFSRPVSGVDRKASNAKEFLTWLCLITNKLKRRTEIPQSDEWLLFGSLAGSSIFFLCDVRTGTRVHHASCPTVPGAVSLDISGRIVKPTFVWYLGVKLRGAYFHVLYISLFCYKKTTDF